MESEQKSGLLKFLITLIILLVVFITYSLSIIFYAKREKLDYKDYSYSEMIDLYNYVNNYQKTIHCNSLTNEEIKVEVQKIIKPSFYLEIKSNREGGRTYAPLRIIALYNKLTGYEYAYTLMHEYIHLTYLLEDESLVDYLSVKMLWESEVPYLQKTACWLIKAKIQYDNEDEYDCTAQMIEYFRINEGIYE